MATWRRNRGGARNKFQGSVEKRDVGGRNVRAVQSEARLLRAQRLVRSLAQPHVDTQSQHRDTTRLPARCGWAVCLEVTAEDETGPGTWSGER